MLNLRALSLSTIPFSSRFRLLRTASSRDLVPIHVPSAFHSPSPTKSFESQNIYFANFIPCSTESNITALCVPLTISDVLRLVFVEPSSTSEVPSMEMTSVKRKRVLKMSKHKYSLNFVLLKDAFKNNPFFCRL
jgi:hypothetical protein